MSLRQGGFKNPFGGRRPTGQSNSFIISLNIKANLPFKLPLNIPLKPYFDIGYYDDARRPIASDATFNDQLMYSGGFMLDFVDGMFGFYFPLINSDNILEGYSTANSSSYWVRVAFNIDLNRANPWRVIDRVGF